MTSIKQQEFASEDFIDSAFLEIENQSIVIATQSNSGKTFRYNCDSDDCLYLLDVLVEPIAGGTFTDDELITAHERVSTGRAIRLSLHDLMETIYLAAWKRRSFTKIELAEINLIARLSTKRRISRFTDHVIECLSDTYLCCGYSDEDHKLDCFLACLALIRGSDLLCR